jgi:hypothetical protein
MNDEEAESICDRCGNPVPVTQIMEDQHSDHRAVCIECYNEYRDEKGEAQSIAAVRAILPELKTFFRAYWQGIPSNSTIRHRFEGKCYHVAIQLQRWLAEHAPALDVRRVHGHWLGRDARPSRASFRFQQHGWLVCRPEIGPDLCGVSVIVDPTQFIFSGAAPHFTVTTNDRNYDEGCSAIREATGVSLAPERAGPLRQTVAWPGDLAAWLGRQIFRDKRDLRQTTIAELFYIANTAPDVLGTRATEVYAALTTAKMGALIPLENRERVAGITSKALPAQGKRPAPPSAQMAA